MLGGTRRTVTTSVRRRTVSDLLERLHPCRRVAAPPVTLGFLPLFMQPKDKCCWTIAASSSIHTSALHAAARPPTSQLSGALRPRHTCPECATNFATQA